MIDIAMRNNRINMFADIWISCCRYQESTL